MQTGNQQLTTGQFDLLKEKEPKQTDRLAEEENKNLISSTKIKRREKLSRHLAFIIIFWLGLALFTIILGGRFLHIILPGQYHWLTEPQVAKIDDLFIHGTIGGLLVAFIKSKMLDKN